MTDQRISNLERIQTEATEVELNDDGYVIAVKTSEGNYRCHGEGYWPFLGDGAYIMIRDTKDGANRAITVSLPTEVMEEAASDDKDSGKGS